CQQSSHDPHYRNPQEQIRRPRFSFSDSLVKEHKQTPTDRFAPGKPDPMPTNSQEMPKQAAHNVAARR
ncbi:hypothetical protein, partial [Methylobacterium goesingense]|uniref:hypothetical protein n=1 Tax=Methylobacterium goesingense TaxID=243690 RepID=UPI0036397848